MGRRIGMLAVIIIWVAGCAAEDEQREVFSGGDAGAGAVIIGGGGGTGGGSGGGVSGDCAERFGPFACLDSTHLRAGVRDLVVEDSRVERVSEQTGFRACGYTRENDEPADLRNIVAEEGGCIAYTGAVQQPYRSAVLDAGIISVDAAGQMQQFELNQNCYSPTDANADASFFEADIFGISANGGESVDSFSGRVERLVRPVPEPIQFRKGTSSDIRWQDGNVNQLAVLNLIALDENSGESGVVTCYINDDGLHRVPSSVTEVFPENPTSWTIDVMRSNIERESGGDPAVYLYSESLYQLTFEEE